MKKLTKRISELRIKKTNNEFEKKISSFIESGIGKAAFEKDGITHQVRIEIIGTFISRSRCDVAVMTTKEQRTIISTSSVKNHPDTIHKEIISLIEKNCADLSVTLDSHEQHNA